MPRLVLPVQHQTLYATGDVKLWVDLVLALRDATGNFVHRRFRIDSATDITTFSAYEAQQLGLAMPIHASRVRHTTGLEVRSGVLRFRIDGLDATEYAVSCFFLGDPAIVPNPTTQPSVPRALLQPLALLDQLIFTAQKDPASAAIYGELTIDNK